MFENALNLAGNTLRTQNLLASPGIGKRVKTFDPIDIGFAEDYRSVKPLEATLRIGKGG